MWTPGSAWRWMPGPGEDDDDRNAAHVHLQRGDRLGIRLVVCILPDDAEAVADGSPRLMTTAAGSRLRPRRHRGAGRDWPRIGIGRELDELPHAAHLRVDEPLGAFADVAVHAGDARVRTDAPRRELRLHRRMTGLSAEAGRLHPVQAAVPGQKNDDDVDRGEGDHEQRRPPDAGDPEVHDRPVGDGVGVADQRLAPSPHSHGDQHQAHQEQRGKGHEHDQTRVRVGQQPREGRQQQREEQYGGDRRDHHAGDRQRMRERFPPRHDAAPTSGSAGKRRARRGPRPGGSRTCSASAASWSTWPSRTFQWDA